MERYRKVRETILGVAQKNPKSRVSMLLREVDTNMTKNNITKLFMELAENSMYATNFELPIDLYCDIFFDLSNLSGEDDEDFVEAGSMMFCYSQILSRRIDDVFDRTHGQATSLASLNIEGETNKKPEELPSNATSMRKGRKRPFDSIPNDPYEIVLAPKKFRTMCIEKRFNNTKLSALDEKKRRSKHCPQMQDEIHPNLWLYGCIRDFETEEEIDTKRNYKLFTYHLEHRYNTLIPDINFGTYFKMKDFMDEVEERIEDVGENGETITECNERLWPPLSEEYVTRYINLENRVLELDKLNAKRIRLNDQNDYYNQSTEDDGYITEAPCNMENTINESHNDAPQINSTTDINGHNSFENSNILSRTNPDCTVFQTTADSGFDSMLNSTANDSTSMDCSTGVEPSSINCLTGVEPASMDCSTEIHQTTMECTVEDEPHLMECTVEDDPHTMECTVEDEIPLEPSESLNNAVSTENVNETLKDNTSPEEISPSSENVESIDRSQPNVESMDHSESNVENPHEPSMPNSEVPDNVVKTSTANKNIKLKYNILEINERYIKRRSLFKLTDDFSLLLKSRMLKRPRGNSISTLSTYKQKKLFAINNNVEDIYITPPESPNYMSDFEGFSDVDSVLEMDDFLGFGDESDDDFDNYECLNNVEVNLIEVDTDIDIDYTESSKDAPKDPPEMGDEIEQPIELNNEIVEKTCSGNEQEIIEEETLHEQDLIPDMSIANNKPNDSNNDNDHTSFVEEINRELEEFPASLPESSEKSVVSIELDNSISRIRQWYAYLRPILAQAKSQHYFDIFAMGTDIMNMFKEPITPKPLSTISFKHITFNDVMERSNGETLSARNLLAALILINENNIGISKRKHDPSQPIPWASIRFELLNTKRRQVAKEDNIGMLGRKRINELPVKNQVDFPVVEQCCKIVKEPKIINDTRSINVNIRNKNNGASNKILFVHPGTTIAPLIGSINLNSVKTLKQVEKTVRDSDDYDSGIFSSEEFTL